MPAIITHDQFGKSALERGLAAPFAADLRQREAFLLGNQGPDPLFYCVANPALIEFRSLGSRMHREKPSALIAALAASVEDVPASGRGVAQAWTAGFLCHYLLDRTAHPLVYAQQNAFCETGVDGLTPEDGSEVHAVIESEIDEMMLYTRTGQTVATFKPQREILRADEQTLATVSYALTRAVERVYGETVRPDLYAKSVHAFRRVQGCAFHSAHGVKRAALGRVERLFRPHSFAQAMTHRPAAIEHSSFDNHEHRTWENPFTCEASTESFNDLFARALDAAAAALPTLADGTLDEQAARRITHGLDFSGRPTED